MQVDGVPSTFDIERESSNGSLWTIGAFYHELDEDNPAKYFAVIFREETIGYLGLWIVVGQAQVTTTAVKESFRDYGLNQLLLNYVMDYARYTCDVVSLEMRIMSMIAQHICKKLGFQYSNEGRNYYGEGEGALAMWVNLNE